MSAAVVHLELHTPDRAAAETFYAGLLHWQPERIDTPHGCYMALQLGGGLGGGVVECGTQRAVWVPYVEVADIEAATARARRLGASVLLEPREGPSGWRSVVSAPAGGEIALWRTRA